MMKVRKISKKIIKWFNDNSNILAIVISTVVFLIVLSFFILYVSEMRTIDYFTIILPYIISGVTVIFLFKSLEETRRNTNLLIYKNTFNDFENQLKITEESLLKSIFSNEDEKRHHSYFLSSINHVTYRKYFKTFIDLQKMYINNPMYKKYLVPYLGQKNIKVDIDNVDVNNIEQFVIGLNRTVIELIERIEIKTMQVFRDIERIHSSKIAMELKEYLYEKYNHILSDFYLLHQLLKNDNLELMYINSLDYEMDDSTGLYQLNIGPAVSLSMLKFHLNMLEKFGVFKNRVRAYTSNSY